jgi:hypothetical protein
MALSHRSRIRSNRQLRLEPGAAPLAIVEVLAGVGRHRLD